jgi:hypothetical protein
LKSSNSMPFSAVFVGYEHTVRSLRRYDLKRQSNMEGRLLISFFFFKSRAIFVARQIPFARLFHIEHQGVLIFTTS